MNRGDSPRWWRLRWMLCCCLAVVCLCVVACGPAQRTGPQASQSLASAKTTPATPTETPIPFARPEFQAGVVFPRWGTNVYGAYDQDWASGVTDIKRQTGARWIEMVVNLYQDTVDATTVHAGSGTPSPDDVAAGILTAREAGFHVFIVTHLSIIHGDIPDAWGGYVSFHDRNQASAWFDSYWSALHPFVTAAAQTHAEQLAIGNEYIGLESAPDDLWNTLIARVHSVYAGTILYNTNWSSLTQPARGWMSNPTLAYMGVSAYQSLVSRPQALTVPQIESVWQQQFLPLLDNLSAQTHKPVLITEIGYRNATDALYQPWVHTTGAPADPQLQAAAYEGALRAALADPHVDGIFFYAWENGPFAPDGLPAAQTLRAIYLSPAA